MKALSMVRPGELSFIELNEPAPQSGEVAIRVSFIGYCGTDLNSYRGANPLMGYPRVPGHEISGTIAALGEGVPAGFAAGQSVTVLPYFNCGTCNSCRMGRPNACKHNQTLGVQREGALTEIICVPHEKVIPVEGIAQRDLALIEPLAVGFHAVRRADVQSDETVVVLGCGMIGLGVALGALDRGATVIGVDLSINKLETARNLGVQHVIDASAGDVLAAVAAITGEDGPHVVVEAVGSEATFQQAVGLAASCGRVVYVGYAKNPVAYETKYFVMKEIEIRGSRGSQMQDFRDVIAFMHRRPSIGDAIVSRVVPFGTADAAMAGWSADPGSFLKILIDVGSARYV